MLVSIRMSSLFGGIGRALSHRQYFHFWWSNAVSTNGRWLYRTAVGWLTWELTHSTVWLGIIGFADIFPTVILSMVSGAIADRIGYLRLMRATQLGICLTTGVFAALTVSGHITIELVLVLSAVYGSLEALSTPPRMSIIHALVPQRDLTAAIALGSATFTAARLLGPAIAGALIAALGTGPVIAIGTLLFVQFLVVQFLLRIDEAGRDRKLSLSLFGDIVTSLRYVAGHPGIRFMMITLMATGLMLRPFMELLPAFAAEVFGRDATGFSILLSSIGAGGLLSGLWLAQRGDTAGLTRMVTLSLLISAIAEILFASTNFMGAAIVFLFAFGFCMLLGGIAAQTLVQNAVDSTLRARVLSLYVVISWGLPALGAVAAGWIAQFVGLQATVGVGAALVVLFWLWARPAGNRLAAGLETIEEKPGAGSA